MTVTVSIVCRNGAETLPEVFDALRAQTRAADQSLFVDDRSTDGSGSLAERHGFRVLRDRSVRGLAAGRNLALAQATGSLFVGLDADVVPATDYLARVEDRFARHPEIAALCGRLEERFTATVADHWRAFHMAQHHGDAEQLDPRFLYGSTLAVRTEVARALGGWDQKLVSNHEDVELSGRLRSAGHRTLYAPDCRAEHLRRDSVGSVLTGFRNWFTPAGEIAGHFASLADWLEKRLDPVIWGIYRYRIEQEWRAEIEDLSAVTSLLPWSMILADLQRLAFDRNSTASITMVPELAQAVARESGADDAISRWIGERLRHRIEPGAGPGLSIDQTESASAIERSALRETPCDLDYWRAVRQSIRCVERDEAAPSTRDR